jgi:hypothetical protein
MPAEHDQAPPRTHRMMASGRQSRGASSAMARRRRRLPRSKSPPHSGQRLPGMIATLYPQCGHASPSGWSVSSGTGVAPAREGYRYTRRPRGRGRPPLNAQGESESWPSTRSPGCPVTAWART